MTYQAKLMAGGKVVIPADLRRELAVGTGDYLVFERDGDRIVLKTYRQVVREVQEFFRQRIPPDVDLVAELIADRRAENVQDEDEARQRSANQK